MIYMYGCLQPRELWFIDLIMYMYIVSLGINYRGVLISTGWTCVYTFFELAFTITTYYMYILYMEKSWWGQTSQQSLNGSFELVSSPQQRVRIYMYMYMYMLPFALPCFALFTCTCTCNLSGTLQCHIPLHIQCKYSHTLYIHVSGLELSGRPTGPSKPMPLILDEEGRVVDTSGRSVQPVIRQPTIKVCHSPVSFT